MGKSVIAVCLICAISLFVHIKCHPELDSGSSTQFVTQGLRKRRAWKTPYQVRGDNTYRMFIDKSFQCGFCWVIKSRFQERLQALSCFSRLIASIIEFEVSIKTNLFRLYRLENPSIK